MKRRVFFGLFTLPFFGKVAPAGTTIPFVARASPAAGNRILTMDMITREAVRLWKNSAPFLKHIDGVPQYVQPGNAEAVIGSAARIRLPVDYIVQSGGGATLREAEHQPMAKVTPPRDKSEGAPL